MNYQSSLKDYKKFLKNLGIKKLENIKIETIVESLVDWSDIMNIQQLEDWFTNQQNLCNMKIQQVPLCNLSDWNIENNEKIVHRNNSFFSIIGISISNSSSREVKDGWDQPIIMEKDNDGGIVGLIRKKIRDVPYYLIEAKAEPGNPDLVQISPTLQATYSNLNQSHGGRKPHFSEFFLNPKENKCEILFDQYLSEDGGRLFKKRNRGMLIEIPANTEIKFNSSFNWVTLFQIKYLIKKTSWVNPHTRSLISHL